MTTWNELLCPGRARSVVPSIWRGRCGRGKVHRVLFGGVEHGRGHQERGGIHLHHITFTKVLGVAPAVHHQLDRMDWTILEDGWDSIGDADSMIVRLPILGDLVFVEMQRDEPGHDVHDNAVEILRREEWYRVLLERTVYLNILCVF